jgi:hypothetical protein
MNKKENKTIESFNEDFCDYLEYHLCETFKNSVREKEKLRGFWCDGVSQQPFIDSQITKKSVNDTRKIETIAWIGKTGQEKYNMTIRFGKYSLRRYAKGASLIDCIPSDETMDWIDIDIENKIIEIRLK